MIPINPANPTNRKPEKTKELNNGTAGKRQLLLMSPGVENEDLLGFRVWGFGLRVANVICFIWCGFRAYGILGFTVQLGFVG